MVYLTHHKITKFKIKYSYRKALYPGRNQNKNESGTKIPPNITDEIKLPIDPIVKSNIDAINTLDTNKPVWSKKKVEQYKSLNKFIIKALSNLHNHK